MVVSRPSFSGERVLNFSGQPKSNAFIKVLGMPIPADKMAPGKRFSLRGSVCIFGTDAFSQATAITSNVLGLTFLPGSTVPSGGSGLNAWAGKTCSDIPNLTDSFLKYEFLEELEMSSYVSLGITYHVLRGPSAVRCANGVTSMVKNYEASAAQYPPNQSNELCVMFGIESADSGSYSYAPVTVYYDLTLEFLN
jgi:hypothetical protein